MLGHLIQEDIEELIRAKRWEELRLAMEEMTPQDLAEIIDDLPPEDEGILFRLLPRERAAAAFSYLPVEQQAELVRSLSSGQTRDLLEAMTPDDRVALLDELPADITRQLIESLSPETAAATRTLLNYPEGTAGHAMTPEYLAVRPWMTANDAIDSIRTSTRRTETLSTLFVIDGAGRLSHDVRLTELVRADPTTTLDALGTHPPVTIPVRTRREEVVRLFERYDRSTLPVVDDDGRMLGILTMDDVMDSARAEATEDMLKIGGLEAIDTPYAATPFLTLLKKRAGWLSVLFFGEMLTATAMARFEDEIAKAVVLALFVPLVISSGGNSGSQASTLIVRALALGELTLGDWWRVGRRELASGLLLGGWLGGIGFLRILLWHELGWAEYGGHWFLIGVTVWISLIGVVTFGSVVGAMLPFALRLARLDPATSSAPFVATLSDVSGLIIYFTVAALVLRGVML